MSLSPINGYDITRMAPEGYTPEDFASILNGSSDFNTSFVSEVFHEEGNLLDMENRDVGTPLAFDRSRNQVISMDSGKTIDTMLPGVFPMFGDADQACPLNVIGAGLKTDYFPRALRRLRDNVLVHSALGAAFVDGYYRVAPTVAGFLLRHGRVLAVATACGAVVEWAYVHGAMEGWVLAAMIGLGLAVAARRRLRRRVVLSVLLMLGLGILALPAGASVLPVTTERMVSESDYIVSGVIDSKESSWTSESGRIVTEVALKVKTSLKGAVNKSQTLHIRLPGGRVGAVVTEASGMPKFKQGGEVQVFLKYNRSLGYLVVGGSRGKFDIVTDKSTGEKYVSGVSVEAQAALKADAKAIKARQKDGSSKKASAKDGRVPLEDYEEYIRKLVKEQEKQR